MNRNVRAKSQTDAIYQFAEIYVFTLVLFGAN